MSATAVPITPAGMTSISTGSLRRPLSRRFRQTILRRRPSDPSPHSELVRECNLNRKTFYYHFEDIYALLKWTLEQNSFFLNCIYDSLGRDQMKRFLYQEDRKSVV